MKKQQVYRRIINLVLEAAGLARKIGIVNILQPGLVKEMIIADILGHELIHSKRQADAHAPDNPEEKYEYLSCNANPYMKSILWSWPRRRSGSSIGARTRPLTSGFPKTGRRRTETSSIPISHHNQPGKNNVVRRSSRDRTRKRLAWLLAAARLPDWLSGAGRQSKNGPRDQSSSLLLLRHLVVR